MVRPATITIDPSQFPERVRRDLLESLRTRCIHPKFHYDSYKQARRWLGLHERYSPARTDPECFQVYEQAFAAAVSTCSGDQVHLLGLGTGGGQKEAQLLQRFSEAGVSAFYTPLDVSTALALQAREAASPWVGDEHCRPVVIDLAATDDLDHTLQVASPAWTHSLPRLVTLFGILPNFETATLNSLLRVAVRPGDILLLSANLAPGTDYIEGVRRVLPLYENAPTREWLLTFLLDLGVERDDGFIRFGTESTDPTPLQRIVATWEFVRECRLNVEGESLVYQAGETLRLFYSVRHTPRIIGELLWQWGLRLAGCWANHSGEEGVFLALRE